MRQMKAASATASPRRAATKPQRMPENQLDLLQTMSKVVADTGVVVWLLLCCLILCIKVAEMDHQTSW